MSKFIGEMFVQKFYNMEFGGPSGPKIILDDAGEMPPTKYRLVIYMIMNQIVLKFLM